MSKQLVVGVSRTHLNGGCWLLVTLTVSTELVDDEAIPPLSVLVLGAGENVISCCNCRNLGDLDLTLGIATQGLVAPIP